MKALNSQEKSCPPRTFLYRPTRLREKVASEMSNFAFHLIKPYSMWTIQLCHVVWGSLNKTQIMEITTKAIIWCCVLHGVGQWKKAWSERADSDKWLLRPVAPLDRCFRNTSCVSVSVHLGPLWKKEGTTQYISIHIKSLPSALFDSNQLGWFIWNYTDSLRTILVLF